MRYLVRPMVYVLIIFHLNLKFIHFCIVTTKKGKARIVCMDLDRSITIIPVKSIFLCITVVRICETWKYHFLKILCVCIQCSFHSYLNVFSFVVFRGTFNRTHHHIKYVSENVFSIY